MKNKKTDAQMAVLRDSLFEIFKIGKQIAAVIRSSERRKEVQKDLSAAGLGGLNLSNKKIRRFSKLKRTAEFERKVTNSLFN